MNNQIIDRVASHMNGEFTRLRDEKIEEARQAKIDTQNQYGEHIEILGQKVMNAISEHDEAKQNANKVMTELLEDFESKVNEIVGEDDGTPLADIADMVEYIKSHEKGWNEFVKEQTEIIERFFSDYKVSKFGDLLDTGMVTA